MGVAFTAAAEADPAGETAFGEYGTWTGSTNVSISENAIDINKPSAIKDGIGKVTFTSVTGDTYTDKDSQEQNITYFKVPLNPSAITNWEFLFLKIKASDGISSIGLYINGVSDTVEALQSDKSSYMCANLLGDVGNPWNVKVIKDSNQGGYEVRGYGDLVVDSSIYGAAANAEDRQSLVFVVSFAADIEISAQFVEFGGMAFVNNGGSAWTLPSTPIFATDNADLEIGSFSNGWGTNSQLCDYTIVNNSEADGDIPAGLAKVSYDETTNRCLVTATVSNVKPEQTRLIVEYYSIREVNMGIYFTWTTVKGYEVYPAGHGYIDVIVPDGVITGEDITFNLYIDSVTQVTDATANTVVIKSITFSKPQTIGDITKAAWFDRLSVEKDGEDTVIKSNLKTATDYQYVNFAVNGWTTAAPDRFIKFVLNADKDFTMGVYNGETNVINAHTRYKSGDNTIYIDTTKATKPLENGDLNICLYFNTEGEALETTIRIKSYEIVDSGVATAPEASALTIDYAAETVSFADTIAVYTDEGNTAIESGAKVTPGAKLYMRTKASDGYTQSELAEFTVPARPTAEDLTPTATADKITVTKAGYSFKIGDGEWTTTGEFTGLSASTEYTITYKADATATSFASEEKTVKVTTKAAAATDDGNKTEEAPKKGCKNALSGGTLYAFLAVCFVVIVFCGVRLIKKGKRD